MTKAHIYYRIVGKKERKEAERMSEKEYKTTEAQRKAIKKYGERFERINCRFEPGTIERISKTGMSANAFINTAVDEKLDNMGIPKEK